MQKTPLFTESFEAQAISFTPAHALYEGEHCHGLKFGLKTKTLAEAHQVPLGLALLAAGIRLGGKWLDARAPELLAQLAVNR